MYSTIYSYLFLYFLLGKTILFFFLFSNIKGPSTLATLFNHMWPRIVADPSTIGRHVAATCMLCMQTLCLWRGRATACRTLEPQTAVCSPKLENNGFLRELNIPATMRGHMWLNKVASVLGP